MILEKELSRPDLFRQVTDWLYAQAQTLGFTIEVRTQLIEERQSDYYTFIRVPVKVLSETETDDAPSVLTKLQFLWNDQEPRPEKLLFLYPAGVPRDAV